MNSIKSYQEQIQEIVEKAISAVEEQHKSLASKSFGYAEKLYNLDTIKDKHDEASAAAYGKVRDVNKRVNGFAADLIAKFEKEESASEKVEEKAKTTAAKKKTAAKSAPKKAAKKEDTASA